MPNVCSILESLQLAIVRTKVNDLCSGGDVVTTNIINESKPSIIFREPFLVVNEQKVKFILKITVSDCEDLGRKVKKTINYNLKMFFIRYAQEEKMIVSYSSA